MKHLPCLKGYLQTWIRLRRGSNLQHKELGAVPLEKGMATHSSILAWRIPWTEEPGGLQSIGLHKVGND